jgi:hypothetical protein
MGGEWTSIAPFPRMTFDADRSTQIKSFAQQGSHCWSGTM